MRRLSLFFSDHEKDEKGGLHTEEPLRILQAAVNGV